MQLDIFYNLLQDDVDAELNTITNCFLSNTQQDFPEAEFQVRLSNYFNENAITFFVDGEDPIASNLVQPFLGELLDAIEEDLFLHVVSQRRDEDFDVVYLSRIEPESDLLQTRGFILLNLKHSENAYEFLNVPRTYVIAASRLDVYFESGCELYEFFPNEINLPRLPTYQADLDPTDQLPDPVAARGYEVWA